MTRASIIWMVFGCCVPRLCLISCSCVNRMVNFHSVASATLTVRQLPDLTVDQLKAELKSRNLPISGKKADLIARMTQYLDSHKPTTTGSGDAAAASAAAGSGSGSGSGGGGAAAADDASDVKSKSRAKPKSPALKPTAPKSPAVKPAVTGGAAAPPSPVLAPAPVKSDAKSPAVKPAAAAAAFDLPKLEAVPNPPAPAAGGAAANHKRKAETLDAAPAAAAPVTTKSEKDEKTVASLKPPTGGNGAAAAAASAAGGSGSGSGSGGGDAMEDDAQATKRRRLGPARPTPTAGGSAAAATPAAPAPAPATQICPYLDTINRRALDFDFEKLCSVSLVNQNVYACLVCGKYFQGRGKQSHAYVHALDVSHYVFINLHNEKIYCLPDGYEVIDASLEDIKYNLHPTFQAKDLIRLDTNKSFTHALDGTDYLPGTVGLNNIKNTDWLNACVQALIHVNPIRDFFIAEANYEKSKKSLLVSRFGELMAKMWNSRSFKGHVSPHELLQAISTVSNKQFRIGTQADPLQFLSWFLNTLHRDLGGSPKPGAGPETVIHRAFQGAVQIKIDKPKRGMKPAAADTKKAEDAMDTSDSGSGNGSSAAAAAAAPDSGSGSAAAAAAAGSGGSGGGGSGGGVTTIIDGEEYISSVENKPFLYLSLALPSAPLFKETADRSLIPQMPLFDLLSKFDGSRVEESADGVRRRYTITRLPRYLIIHFRRFQQNNWFTEKNPTLVNFPIKHLDLKPYTSLPPLPTACTEPELIKLSVAELKSRLEKAKGLEPAVKSRQFVEKSELVSVLVDYYKRRQSTRYDLVANICHDGKPDKGTYRAHIYQKATDTWYEMQDLRVFTTETMPQLVALSESYVQIYEKKDS